ncbi:MAG TPA: DUF3293 domain-containing protein [Steroidobacteraceae bacterium]|nr:DUF3293 domain-containing protein [Steroidobacteraceae bacterium]
MSDRLTDAYRAAVYRVELPGENVELRVDVHSASLQRWLGRHEHHCAALLTAHNPESQPRDAALNDAAQRNLQAAIRMRGLTFQIGRNLDPQGHWPPEDSVLVPDLPLEEARALALQFHQRAFLWCDASGTPQLHHSAMRNSSSSSPSMPTRT